MGSKKEYPIRFTPAGVADSFDASDSFPGACRLLQNLALDQSNSELVYCRPGVGNSIVDFSSFTTPTQITVQITVGNTVYGMLSSGLNAGKDQPFAYVVGGAFITITGITAANTPTTPLTTGDWVCATMAVIGAKIIVTHPGFAGGSYFFGIIDISNPAAPVWTAKNTDTNALPSVPTGVTNFNNRAWYICKNNAYYSDVLVADKMTNAGQALTVGDLTNIIAFSGLPIQTSSGGVVSGLMVFKQFQIWQIIGDAAITGSLSINFLSLNVGCLSPRTITQTPVGTIFAGMDGPYLISPLGAVIPLTKDSSKLTPDLQAPFQNIRNPSRACGSFSGSIYRVCLETIRDGNNTVDDYWFDVTRRRWSGPHTFAYDCVSQVGNYFLLSSRTAGAKLFKSQYMFDTSSVYTDNGSQIRCILESSSFPKTQNINMKQVVESTVELSSVAQALTFEIDALDYTYSTLDTVSITVNSSTFLWGAGIWGEGIWGASINFPKTYTIPWSIPIVFKKFGIRITVSSASSVSIGTLFAKYKDAGYTNV